MTALRKSGNSDALAFVEKLEAHQGNDPAKTATVHSRFQTPKSDGKRGQNWE